MKMAYFLIAVGLVCLIAGIILYFNSPKEIASFPDVAAKIIEVNTETAAQLTEQSGTPKGNENDESKEKGMEFEEYVVSRFSTKYFTLKEWRGDKYSNGIYAESNTYPDMEYTFTLREESYAFAVECKWRSKFNSKGKVKWSYKDQLARYRQFAQDRNMPVFIIIGIGGIPATPAEIYVVPLASIKETELSKNWLENYRHNLAKKMYFDIPTKTLR